MNVLGPSLVMAVLIAADFGSDALGLKHSIGEDWNVTTSLALVAYAIYCLWMHDHEKKTK